MTIHIFVINPIVENNVERFFFRACAMTVVRAPDRGVLILGLIAAVSAFIVSSSLVCVTNFVICDFFCILWNSSQFSYRWAFWLGSLGWVVQVPIISLTGRSIHSLYHWFYWLGWLAFSIQLLLEECPTYPTYLYLSRIIYISCQRSTHVLRLSTQPSLSYLT